MLFDEIKTLIYSILLSPASRTYWLYLLIYAGIGVFLFHRHTQRDGRRTELLARLIPPGIYRHASFRMDLKLWMLSLLITRLGAFALLAGVVQYLSVAMISPVAAWLPMDALAIDSVTIIDRLLFTLITIVVLDLGYFAAHHLSHKVPLLWAFHQVHHAAEHLTPITASRFHPVDHLFTAFVGTLLSSVAVAAFTLCHGTDIETITVLNVSVVYFLFLLSANFRHSHIWISYGPLLSRVLVSPCMHQIHHSTEPRHIDRNFGFIFSFWDRLFHCRYIPQKTEKFAIGLLDKRLTSDQSVFTHVLAPFADAFQLLRAMMPLRHTGKRSGNTAVSTRNANLPAQPNNDTDP